MFSVIIHLLKSLKKIVEGIWTERKVWGGIDVITIETIFYKATYHKNDFF